MKTYKVLVLPNGQIYKVKHKSPIGLIISQKTDLIIGTVISMTKRAYKEVKASSNVHITVNPFIFK